MNIYWLMGAMFTYGVFISTKNEMSKTDWVLLAALCFFAWPVVIGGIVGERIEK